MDKKRAALSIILILIVSVISLLAIVDVGAESSGIDGKILYEKSCRTCHGANGKGNTKLATNMKVDLAKLDLTDKETTSKKDGEWTKIINDGAGKMKGFKDRLKPEEITVVIKYIRSLK